MDVGLKKWAYVLGPTMIESADGARDTGVFEIVIGGPPGISVADGATKIESELAENAWPNTEMTEGLCRLFPAFKEGSDTGTGTAPGTAGCD